MSFSKGKPHIEGPPARDRENGVPAVANLPKARLHFPFADGFRALAILFVFFQHVDTVAPAFPHHLRASTFVTPFDGITMLFILSGFLLSGPFLHEFFSCRPLALVHTYFLARFLRIYPLYAVAVVTITFYLIASGHRPSSWDILSHVFMLHGFSPATVLTISGPLWTMAVDAEFYILLPLVFAALTYIVRSDSRKTRISAVVCVLLTITVGSVAYRYAVIRLHNPRTFDEALVYVNQLPGMLCVFCVGIGLRVLQMATGTAMTKGTSFATTGAVLAALALWPIYFLVTNARQHWMATGRLSAGTLLWSVEGLVAAAGCGLFLFAVFQDEHSALTRWLSSRFFTFAASISYAFYLFHLVLLDRIVPSGHTASWGLLARTAAVAIAILVPVCYLLHRTIEKPCLDLKSRLRRFARSDALTNSDRTGARGLLLPQAAVLPGSSQEV